MKTKQQRRLMGHDIVQAFRGHRVAPYDKLVQRLAADSNQSEQWAMGRLEIAQMDGDVVIDVQRQLVIYAHAIGEAEGGES